MRTIEEIKAKIEAYNRYEDVPKELREEYNKLSFQIWQENLDDSYKRRAATKDIPLDRLKEICEAERDGRLVEVVRCKDCKESRPYIHNINYALCAKGNKICDNNYYCSYGERSVENDTEG